MKGVTKALMKQNKIITLLHARDQQAIDELKSAYGRLCQCLASRVLDCSQDVEEVVSDAYLSVWNSIPPEQPTSLLAYLCGITRKLSISRLRENTAMCRDQRLTTSLDELVLTLPDKNDDPLDRIVLTQAINGFLTTLDETNRYIFLRRYYFMDTTKEISKKLSLTDQSIRSRLLRMRAQLREILEKEGISV